MRAGTSAYSGLPGPLPGEAALLVPGSRGEPPSLIVADLHLGLGGDRRDYRGPPGGSAPELAERLIGAAHRGRARRVIVAGDAKHPIVGTPPALRPVLFDFFSTLLSAGLETQLVVGNHDAGIEPYLPREVRVRSASGALVGDVGVFHGHCWPDPRVLQAKTLVVGHLHPGFRLAPTSDASTSKSRCWLRVRYPPVSGKTKGAPDLRKSAELIVLPTFNPLCGAEALNRDRPARIRTFLVRRFVAPGEARAYLLDGTDLGRVITSALPRA